MATVKQGFDVINGLIDNSGAFNPKQSLVSKSGKNNPSPFSTGSASMPSSPTTIDNSRMGQTQVWGEWYPTSQVNQEMGNLIGSLNSVLGNTTPQNPQAPPTPPPATPPAPAPPVSNDFGLDPLTGFAARYTPAMLDQLYENPWFILRDLFPGISESDPLYQAMRDLGGDPLALFNIAVGSQQPIDGGAEQFVNWIANMYKQQGTVGGADFDARQLLGALFGQNAFGADSGNVLGQILGAGDMATQIRTLYNMARDVSNVAMNPLAARGYQAALAQAGDRYGQSQLSTEPGANGPQNPSAWIAANMPWLAGRT